MNFFVRYILPVILIVYISVNWLFDEPIHENISDQIENVRKKGDNKSVEVIFNSLQKDSLFQPDDHFAFINYFFDFCNTQEELQEQYLQAIEMYYNQMSFSDIDSIRDLSYFSIGLLKYKQKDFGGCVDYLGQIKNGNFKRLNNYYGLIYVPSNIQFAEWYFKQEINSGGDKFLAYNNLVKYVATNDSMILDSLLSLEEGREYILAKTQREYFLKKGDFINYNSAVFKRIKSSFDVLAFLGAFLIIIIWIIYLRKIDYTSYRKPLIRYFLIFLLGMVLSYFTTYLSDYNKFIREFSWNEDLLNDFMYCFIGIGVVEEFVKLIPVLLLMYLTKWFKEPIDFVVFACVSALGFSFVENNLYFANNGLNIIQGRAITATVSHMFDSSIIAYGMVIGKFTKKNFLLYLISFFLLASLIHGFYDFWLIRFPDIKAFQFITLVFLLISMFVWTSIINNCLNNSSSFSTSKNYNQKSVFLYLLIGLSSIYIYEFVSVAYRFGPTFANQELVKDLLSGVFLLLFVTFSLSRLDIIKNYWAPITLWDWQTVMNLPSIKPVFFDLGSILGTKIRIESFRKASPLYKYSPIEGVIIKRELISWEKDWYLVKLENPITVGWKMYEYTLIKVKNKQDVILKNDGQLVYMRLVNSIDDLNKKIKKKGDYLFMDFAKVYKEQK